MRCRSFWSFMSIVVLGGESRRGAGPESCEPVSSPSGWSRAISSGRAKIPVLLAFVRARRPCSRGADRIEHLLDLRRWSSSSVTGLRLVPRAGCTPLSTAVLPRSSPRSMALPVALLAVRHGSRIGQLLERSTYLVLAMPGVVIAFALGYFSERYANGFAYQSAPMLVLAYADLVLPASARRGEGVGGLFPGQTSRRSPALSGCRALEVFVRVTLPLVGPGIAAAFCLVFLAAVTELTATLILRPTGVETLATQFWSYEQNLSYGQAAPFALVMILVAAVPSYVIGRYFDRLPSRASASDVTVSSQESDFPMTPTPLPQRESWKALESHHSEVKDLHLRDLFSEDPQRGTPCRQRPAASTSTIRRTGSPTRRCGFCSSCAENPTSHRASRDDVQGRAHKRLRGPRRPARRTPDATRDLTRGRRGRRREGGERRPRPHERLLRPRSGRATGRAIPESRSETSSTSGSEARTSVR